MILLLYFAPEKPFSIKGASDVQNSWIPVKKSGAPEARGDPPPRPRRGIDGRHRAQLQCERLDDFEAHL